MTKSRCNFFILLAFLTLFHHQGLCSYQIDFEEKEKSVISLSPQEHNLGSFHLEIDLKKLKEQEKPENMAKNADQFYQSGKKYEAFELYKNAAKKGSVHAMERLAFFLWYEKNDLENALKWALKAAENNSVEAMFRAGVIYNKLGNIKKSLEYYEKGGENGHASSMNNAAFIYDQLGKRDKSFSLYEKAAHAGFIPAMRVLGAFYHEKEDMANALKWSINAAEKGDMGSILNTIALYYEQGNIEKSLEWLMEASEVPDQFIQRVTDTMNTIWNNHPDESLTFYEEGAEKGDVRYLLYTAMYYEHRQDIFTAMGYYKEAMDKGDPVAEEKYNSLQRRIFSFFRN